MNSSARDVQGEIWDQLLLRARSVLSSFGKENAFGEADYLVVDDNYNLNHITVEVQNLAMLRPEVVSGLRTLVRDLPGWQVVMVVDVPEKEFWPSMGLMIRRHEIVDGLRREFLPEAFKTLSYPDSRAGDGYDRQ